MVSKPMKDKGAVARKNIKKKFFEVKAPLVSAPIFLYGAEIEEFENKVVKIDLTKNLRGKSFELRMQVHVKGNELEAEPISLNLLMSYIRRIMRAGIDYVEDSFDAECRDAIVKVKPFLLTRKKVSRAVRQELRNTAREFIQAKLKNRTAREIFSEIMTNRLQKELSLKLKKIYPLAFCDIRAFQVIRAKKQEELKEIKEGKIESKEVQETQKEKKE